MKRLRENVRNALSVHGKQVHLIPDVAIKLLRLTADENADIRDLSKVIETEPALATQILKTVNSSLFNCSHPISSIQRAVSLLGFTNIRSTAIKLLFYNNLIAKPTGQSFNLVFFWQHSLFVATLSREIAINLDYTEPDLLYTAGLLHDIGKLVLETYGKVSYSDFISNSSNFTGSTVKNELIYFGVSHEQVGYIYCLDLQLPEVIASIVANHNSDQTDTLYSIEFKQENAIVAFANYLAGIQGLGSFAEETPLVLTQSISEYIDVSALDIESLLNQVDNEMQKISQFYGIQFPTINQLRAKLINSTIQLNNNLQNSLSNSRSVTDGKNLLSALTIPHQTLDAEIFVPQTLRAIHDTFGFDRVFMLGMIASQNKGRRLIANHSWPILAVNSSDQTINIDIDHLTGDLLSCLRSRNAAVIRDHDRSNRDILAQIGVTEFIAVPILRNKRLCAVLYVDNKFSKKTIEDKLLPKLSSIAKELGTALANAQCFDLEKNRAEIDPLTGLSNKRMITDFLEKLFSENKNELSKICAGFLDIDRFKKLNDECGHQVGDEALTIVADSLKGLTRDGDFVGRYGGEEFVFVLPSCTPVEANQYAERIRAEIEAKGIEFKNRFKDNKLTASIGIAMYQPHYSNYPELIAAADKAMYQAKSSGRNKVVSVH